MRFHHNQHLIAYAISVMLLLTVVLYIGAPSNPHAEAAARPSGEPAYSVFETSPPIEPSPQPANRMIRVSALAKPETAVASAPMASAAPARPQAVAASPEPSYDTYEITAHYLNVRANPYASSKILEVIEMGTVVEVASETDNGWLRLKEGGYVHGGYAKLISADKKSVPNPETSLVPPSGGEQEEPGKPTSLVDSDSGLSAEHVAELLEGTALSGLGLEQSILEVEKDLGINAYFTIAVMKLESGNGESKLAKKKNNLFGLNAIDGSAYESATRFKTKEECIRKFGELIAENYVDRGYTTVEKVARKYCSANSKWPKLVKSIMASDYGKL